MNAAPYLHIAGTRFRALLQYRGAALGGLFTQTFFGLVRIMVLSAFYAASAAPPPMPLASVVAYVWLGQAMFLLFPWRPDPDVAEPIRTGNIAYELCRPLDLHTVWMARALAMRTAPVLLRLVPMLVVAAAIMPAIGLPEWRLPAPASPTALVVGIAAFAGAVALSAALTTLVHVGLLYTVGGDGIPILVGTVAVLLGGLIVPLPLFPAWAQPWLVALPFAGILDLPARAYTGAIAAADAPWVLVHQAVWTAILVGLGRLFLARQLRVVALQGG
jgi:ABC-2 type transport system permease protein